MRYDEMLKMLEEHLYATRYSIYSIERMADSQSELLARLHGEMAKWRLCNGQNQELRAVVENFQQTTITYWEKATRYTEEIDNFLKLAMEYDKALNELSQRVERTNG